MIGRVKHSGWVLRSLRRSLNLILKHWPLTLRLHLFIHWFLVWTESSIQLQNLIFIRILETRWAVLVGPRRRHLILIGSQSLGSRNLGNLHWRLPRFLVLLLFLSVLKGRSLSHTYTFLVHLDSKRCIDSKLRALTIVSQGAIIQKVLHFKNGSVILYLVDILIKIILQGSRKGGKKWSS